MSSECYVSLSHSTSEPCAVSWSEDQRITVTTNEVVYVLTLRVPLSLANVSDPASIADNGKRLPLFIMSTVPTPVKSQLSKLKLGGVNYSPLMSFPPAGNWPFMEIVDPILQEQDLLSRDLFQSSDWTPPGCSALGGCLLSCLTRGGRLLLYAPPGLLGNRWRLVMDLTAQHNTHLLSCNFDPHSIATRSPTPPPATCTTEDGGQTEPPSNSDSSPSYFHRKLSLTVTCFAWLPALVKTELSGKSVDLALVAMATRLGHVILMGVEVPLDSGCESNVMTLQVIEDFTADKREHESWVSSLKWTRRDNGAWLGVGLTDGRVGLLHWNDLSLSLLHPSLSLLWTEEDSIPVHCLAWDHPTHSPDQPRWLAASKGSLIVVFDIMNVPNYTLISGIHSATVSGICSLSTVSWQFVSASLDGTLQTFQAPRSHDGHVTPKLVTMETIQPVQGGTHSIHGIAMSKNSLFAAVALNQKHVHGRIKTRQRFQLHFLPMFNNDKNFDISSAVWSWDVVEYLRCLSEEQLTKVRRSVSEPRLALHAAVVGGREETEVIRCKEEVMSQHLNNSLKRWTEWSESVQQNDQMIDASSSLSLSLMCHWLSVMASTSNTRQPTNCKLAKTLPDGSSPEESVGEVCTACGEPLSVTNLFEETCQNGHTWKRCGITLCLVVDSQCSSCMQCGAMFNNTQSVSSSQGSWMCKLLEEHSTCLFCGGHFEQLM